MDVYFSHPALACGVLALTVVALWFRQWWWTVFFCVFIGVCLWQGLMTPVALVPVLTLAVLYLSYARYASGVWTRLGLIALLSLLSVGLGVHAFPGFSFWELDESVRLSDASAEYALRYYFDKPLIGVFVLGLAYTGLSRSRADWQGLFSSLWRPLLVTLVVVYLLSLALGYTRWDPKFSSTFWPWACKNLLFVCVAEEAFFRGFIQRQLADLIPHQRSKVIALVVAAGLFGVAHIAGGLTYVLLATVAGLGYGYAYHVTGRIEASIATHFILNAGHFLFFTYPYRIGLG